MDAGNIIISHMDNIEGLSFKIHEVVAERGAYVEFDCFGEEDYIDELNRAHPRDSERVVALKRLIDEGFIGNLLISQDTCMKMHLRKYGGHGYDHLQRRIIPMLKRLGVTASEIRRITVSNPLRAVDC